ncbi:hypothetical protein EAF04_000905 [Stromatinia cepivora]|nr:hypothetical protein EAF04_000905 [Stromatinia cepivora]
MPPKKKSNFGGAGRTLGATDEKLVSSDSEDDDYEYSSGSAVHSDEEEEDGEEEDREGRDGEGRDGEGRDGEGSLIDQDEVESEGDEEDEDAMDESGADLSANEIESSIDGGEYQEIVLPNGEIQRVRTEGVPTEEVTTESLLKDERYTQSEMNGRLRFAAAVISAEANVGIPFSVIDMSDHGAKSQAAKTIKSLFRPCTNGEYVATGKKNKKGKPYYKKVPGGPPKFDPSCQCKHCTKRRDFAGHLNDDSPAKTSRSGLKRGINKYGEGQMVGGAAPKKLKK